MKILKTIVTCMVLCLLWPISVSANYWGSVTLKVGEKQTLTLNSSTASILNSPSVSVTSASWSSNSSCVRIVSQNRQSCVIQGVSAGSANITFKCYYLANYMVEEMVHYYSVTVEGGTDPTPDPTPDPDEPIVTWQQYGYYEINWYNKNQKEFTLSTNKELAGVAYLVNNGYADFSGATILLTADIDLGDAYWIGIGNSVNKYFRGTFDGQGHTISNVNFIESEGDYSYIGLFGNIRQATIRNIVLQGEVDIDESKKRYSYIGGIVAYATNQSTIEYCRSEIDITYRQIGGSSGAKCIGGILGCGDDAKLYYCSHVGDIYVSQNFRNENYTAPLPRIGGVAGGPEIYSMGCYLYYCENVSSSISYYRGPGLGYMNPNGSIIIPIGGILGNGSMEYCRSIVDKMRVTTEHSTNYSVHIGLGMAGNGSGSVTNCYSILNSVYCDMTSSQTYWHGIATNEYYSQANYSNSDVEVTIRNERIDGYHGSTAFTAAQMKEPAFLQELNMYTFINEGKGIWTPDEDGYPCIAETHSKKPVGITLSNCISIDIGETVTLIPEITPSTATTSFTWSSDNTDIATVNSSGAVTGVNEGTTYIWVETNNGLKACCEVTVEKKIIEPTDIYILGSPYIDIGDKVSLWAEITPSDATTTLVWWSEDPDIATVSSSGVVTGVSKGTTRIWVETDNGLKDSYEVNVMKFPTSISMPSEITINVCSVHFLNPEIIPSDAETPLYWSIDNNNIAMVDYGKVLGRKPGKAMIEVYTANDLKALCQVTVIDTLDFKSLGYGVYLENFLVENDEINVEILQEKNDPNLFRIESPYDSDGSEYLQIKTWQDSLVYFWPVNTGYYYSDYGGELWLWHPHNVTSMKDESYWLHNRVLSYYEEGQPKVIQLAPWYFLEADWQQWWWDCTQEDDIIKITLPAPDTDGIAGVTQDANSSDSFYNLSGQRVERPRKGLYIKGGKKVLVK